MTSRRKEGCIWMTMGGLIAFWMIVYMTVKVIAMAWRD